MKLYFRLLFLIFSQFLRSRCDVRGPVNTSLRVYPNDLDVNGHVNNGVYLTYADLGRIDLLLRADCFWRIVKNGWYPVVITETVRFYKSLKVFRKFEISTRVLGWDDKDFLLEQRFEREQELYAVVIVNARFLARRGGSVSTEQLLSALGVDEQSPELPSWVAEWQQAMQQCDVLNKPR